MRKVNTLIAILALVVLLQPISAVCAPGNIRNGGFEDGFIRKSMSQFIPSGWTIIQPVDQHGAEIRPTNPIYANRIHTGNYALQMMNVFSPFNVLVYQSQYTPGGVRNYKVDFSIFFHGWWWESGPPDYEENEWGEIVPVSEKPMSRGWAFVSTTPPSVSQCTTGSGRAVQDNWEQVSASATLPPNTRFWVGICLNSPAAQTNDFYVDSASLNVEVIPDEKIPSHPTVPDITYKSHSGAVREQTNIISPPSLYNNKGTETGELYTSTVSLTTTYTTANVTTISVISDATLPITKVITYNVLSATRSPRALMLGEVHEVSPSLKWGNLIAGLLICIAVFLVKKVYI